MPPVSVMIKPVSGSCNMKCDYCFYTDETRKRQQECHGIMSEQTLKNVIRRALLPAEEGISFLFQGGEPLLRGLPFYEKVLQYEAQYNKHHIAVSNAIQTNGYAINEEWCRFFAKNHFLVGLSVDGTKELHDAYRHTKSSGSSYERCMYAVKLLKQYGVEFNILTVVTGKTAGCIEEIYEDYQKQEFRFQQYIACLDPLYESHGMQSYALSPGQYGSFLVRLFNCWYQDMKNNRQPYIRQFENYIGILRGYLPESCEQRGTCSVQNVVEADGSVYPCDFYMIDDYYLGNFNTDTLAVMNQRRDKTDFLSRSEKLPEECVSCPYFKLCRGGCQRNRDFLPTHNVYQNYLCEGYRFFFENCLDRLREIAGNL